MLISVLEKYEKMQYFQPDFAVGEIRDAKKNCCFL